MTSDPFVGIQAGARSDPPGTAGERATLLDFVRRQRETLEWKCSGLDPEQLARRSVEPSTMSLIGLVRHLADVERGWVRGRIAEEVAEPLYWRADDEDAAFSGAEGTSACVEEAWKTFHETAAWTDRFVSEAPSLEITCQDRRGTLSLRWVLMHLVEEYARHLGHADLIRERIDGAVGE